MTPLPLVSLLSALVATAQTARAAPDSTLKCFDTSITWYNSHDKNPCQQFQELMLQCDSDFKVPRMSIPAGNNAPTICSPEMSACCCNSVAFSLAMACLNCQTGGDANRNGYNGPPQTFNHYLNACSPVGMNSLNTSIQEKVCTTGPILQRWAYELNNRDGSWNYTDNMMFASRLTNAGTGDSIKCGDKPVKSQQNNKEEDAQNSQPLSSGGNSTVGPIVGAVVGTVAFMLLAFFAFWWFFMRRRRPVHHHGPGSASDFDLLHSNRHSRATSVATLEPLPAFIYSNPYANASQRRERPETQTFSELTLPVPISVPSDFQSSMYSQTPFSARPPSVDGGESSLSLLLKLH
ncbi:hypothetical protein AURDEDRAFT_169223 [Auricularia subglabra TFB-10046 SS5]|nr:hypothetical protein AURDEDRAFT_169223 [Auricularia subglabra TFB-10046 SS5]